MVDKRFDFTKVSPENFGQALEEQFQYLTDNVQNKIKIIDKNPENSIGQNSDVRIVNDGTNVYPVYKIGDKWYKSTNLLSI